MKDEHVVEDPDPDNPLFVEASEVEEDKTDPERIIWGENGLNEDFDRSKFLEGSE